MGIALSILLIAGGAIIRYGVTTQPSGLNLDAVGLILIVVGGIGLVFASLFAANYWPFGGGRSFLHEREVVERDPAHHATQPPVVEHHDGEVRREYIREQRRA
jgi:hypothetical protein